MSGGGDALSIRQIDERPLTGRQRKLIGAAVIADMMEFFDFFLLGFILALVVGPWELTYTETAVLILTGGVGSIVGAFGWGRLADRIGRRPVFLWTVITFSVATGLMALTPEDGWVMLAVLRFFVGFGVGGLYVVDLPLVQEYVPTRRRGAIGGIVTVFVPAGLLLGSALSALLGDEIGWRGLVVIGALPALATLWIRRVVPESPRWLIEQGRTEEARASIAWMLETRPEEIDLPEAPRRAPARWGELLRYRRSAAVSWGTNLTGAVPVYGIILWGPTLLALSLDLDVTAAATLFMAVAGAGIAGRITFSVLSDRIGRPRAGMLMGVGGTALLCACAFASLEATVIGIPVFVVTMLLAFFFVDGGFAIVGPYGGEVWPQRLRTSGMGAAYGIGGVGRIIGPIGLAFIAGSSQVVSPAATVDAITPAFLFLAAFAAGTGVIFMLFGIETRGRSLEQVEAGLEEAATARELVPRAAPGRVTARP